MNTNYKRFILVGANPYRGYTNTLTYTDLKVIGSVDTEIELKKLVEDSYDDCGGLLHVIDLQQENNPEIPFQ